MDTVDVVDLFLFTLRYNKCCRDFNCSTVRDLQTTFITDALQISLRWRLRCWFCLILCHFNTSSSSDCSQLLSPVDCHLTPTCSIFPHLVCMSNIKSQVLCHVIQHYFAYFTISGSFNITGHCSSYSSLSVPFWQRVYFNFIQELASLPWVLHDIFHLFESIRHFAVLLLRLLYANEFFVIFRFTSHISIPHHIVHCLYYYYFLANKPNYYYYYCFFLPFKGVVFPLSNVPRLASGLRIDMTWLPSRINQKTRGRHQNVSTSCGFTGVTGCW